MRMILVMVVAATSTSCFAVTNLDRFDTPPTANFTDLRFTMRGMKSHVNEYVEYRVVDATSRDAN